MKKSKLKLFIEDTAFRKLFFRFISGGNMVGGRVFGITPFLNRKGTTKIGTSALLLKRAGV